MKRTIFYAINGLLLNIFFWHSVAFANPSHVTISSAYTRAPYIDEISQSGLELDLIKAAFNDQKMTVSFDFFSRNRQKLNYEQNKSNAMMTINEFTQTKGFWSDVYISYNNVAITLDSFKGTILKVDDLSKLSVAAFLNAKSVLGPDFKKMADANSYYLEVSPQQIQNRMLYLKRIDVVVADKFIFQDLNKLIGPSVNTRVKLTFHPIFQRTNYKMIFHDETLRDKFNQGLRNIKNNGVYEEITAQYLSHFVQ